MTYKRLQKPFVKLNLIFIISERKNFYFCTKCSKKVTLLLVCGFNKTKSIFFSSIISLCFSESFFVNVFCGLEKGLQTISTTFALKQVSSTKKCWKQISTAIEFKGKSFNYFQFLFPLSMLCFELLLSLKVMKTLVGDFRQKKHFFF